MSFPVSISRRLVAASAAVSLALVAAVTLPHSLAPRLADAVGELDDANPLDIWLGGGAFLAALACSAAAWRTAICECGGTISRARATACYGVGSLANSLLPGRVGDAVRVALFSRAIPPPGGVWTSGGIFATLGLARAVVLSLVVAAGWASGTLPLWPLLLLAGALALAAILVGCARRTRAAGRVAHLLDGFRALSESPRACLAMLAWIAASTAARFGGVAAVAAALGTHRPVAAALIVVPALEVAALFPLTPGNLGVTSGAVALALQSRGIDLTSALSIGIALHAVEMVAGVSFGAASALSLAASRTARGRRATAAASAVAALAIAAAFAATLVYQ